MAEEQRELDMEVTVKQEDIEECIKEADEIEKKMESEEKTSEYYIYEPDVIKENYVIL